MSHPINLKDIAGRLKEDLMLVKSKLNIFCVNVRDAVFSNHNLVVSDGYKFQLYEDDFFKGVLVDPPENATVKLKHMVPMENIVSISVVADANILSSAKKRRSRKKKDEPTAISKSISEAKPDIKLAIP